MPHIFTIPFYAFEMHLAGGTIFSVPMTDTEVLYYKRNIYYAAAKFKNAYQRHELNDGEFESLLDEVRNGDFYKDNLTIEIKASKDNLAHDVVQLSVPFFWTETEGMYWGIIPQWSVESVGNTIEELEANLQFQSSRHIESNQRFDDARTLLMHLWVKTNGLQRTAVNLSAPLVGEEKANKSNESTLLTKVSQPLQAPQLSFWGYKKALKECCNLLQQPHSKNVILIGPNGVGKTALLHESVRLTNAKGSDLQVHSSTAALLMKELSTGAGWEANIHRLVSELNTEGGVLYFPRLIDLFEVGRSMNSNISVGEYLQTFITNGELNIIAECTREEWSNLELKYGHFLAVFNTIELEIPGDKELESIVSQKVNAIATTNDVRIEEGVIKQLIWLFKRFNPYAGLPGQPIRFFESLLLKRQLSVSSNDEVRWSDVVTYFAKQAAIPSFLIDKEQEYNPAQVLQLFKTKVIGQDRALEAVVDMMTTLKTSLIAMNKPIASFVFAGPTGVGKTEVAKQLTNYIFGSERRMVRFDMSEYASFNAVLRLKGYGGNDGLLGDAIRKHPFCVLLFDEIEKAHPVFFDFLLQILDEGRFTTADGYTVNLCSTMILMTTNIGAEAMQHQGIGWQSNKYEVSDVQSHFMGALQKYLRPEIFNRIDKVIAFNPLEEKYLPFIINREMDILLEREGIKSRAIEVSIADNVAPYLAKQGYDIRYGARGMKRLIRREVILPLAKVLNQYNDEEISVKLSIEENKITIAVEYIDDYDAFMLKYQSGANVDTLSNTRKKMSSFMHSTLVLNLRSEIIRLEQLTKNQDGSINWKVKGENADYEKQLKKGLEQALELEADIAQLELDLSVEYLKDGDTSHAEATVDNLSKRFFELQQYLYSITKVENNACYLAIWGLRNEAIIEAYEEIFEALGFEIEKTAYFYKESHYLQSIAKEEMPYRKFEEGMKFDDKDQWLGCGVQFKVKGPCAWLFFKALEETQEWLLDGGEESRFVLIGNIQEIQPASNVHRQEYYRRRKINLYIKESKQVLKFSEKNKHFKEGFVAYVVEQLKNNFEDNLVTELA